MASVSEPDSTASVSATIDDLERDARRWIALETMLFEELGRLARSSDVPVAARTPAATWCHRHAWHTELWDARVPVIPHRDFAVDDGLGFVEETRALIVADPSVLVTMVLPSLAAEHVPEHQRRIDRRLDGPTARILDLVAADYVAELTELSPHLTDGAWG